MPRTLLSGLLALYCLAASASYKCVDEKGVSHFEDVPPAACGNVVIYEVNRSGGVVRKIEPTQAPRPAAPGDIAKKTESDRAALDRQRRDRTLLDTFASEQEIDRARDRSLDLIKARMESAERQLELVRKRRKMMEGSAPKQGPASKDLEAVRGEEAAIERTLAGYRAEAERVATQFETDKQRWRELRAHSGRR